MPIFNTEKIFNNKYYNCSILIETNKNKLIRGKNIVFNPKTIYTDPNYDIGKINIDNLCLKKLFRIIL